MVGVHAIHNGKVILAKDAVVPVSLREVQFGFSTYALRVLRPAVHLTPSGTSGELLSRYQAPIFFPSANQRLGACSDTGFDCNDEASLRIHSMEERILSLHSSLRLLTYPLPITPKELQPLRSKGSVSILRARPATCCSTISPSRRPAAKAVSRLCWSTGIIGSWKEPEAIFLFSRAWISIQPLMNRFCWVSPATAC